ncbi:carbon-nitrogen hydrolase, partial [Basidiobolus meristosporus CBS 931.73]
MPVTFHLLLPLIFLLTVFGPGFQSVSIFPYFSLTLSLYYVTHTQFFNLLFLSLALSLGSTFAYLGVLQNHEWALEGILITIGSCFLIGSVLTLPFVIYKVFLTRWSNLHLSTLVFPISWTGVWIVYYYISPIGSWGSYAYSQFGIEPIVQLSSIAGISAIDFLLSWSASVFNLLLNWEYFNSFQTISGEEQPLLATQQRDRSSPAEIKLPWKKLTTPVGIYLSAVIVLFSYGAARHNILPGSFYMKFIDHAIVPTVKLGCVIGNNIESKQSDYFDQTRDLANKGGNIIIWSESAVSVKNPKSYDSLMNQARNVSATYGIYLGVTYNKQYPGEKYSQNMVTLFDPKGQIAYKYQKSHPVVIVESHIAPGPKVIPYVDTPEYGRLASAICFDLDFNTFMRQAGENEVDFLLQPSWTWGPIGKYHSEIQSFRAVENGMNLLRCSSWSPSTVYDPFHHIYAYKQNLGVGSMLAEVPLRRHTKTLYTIFGDLFAWCCFAATLLYVTVSWIPLATIGKWPALVQLLNAKQ